MRLSKFTIKHYRSIREAVIDLDDLTLFIGPNGAGKSTILDALQFLHEAMLTHDFMDPYRSRGGMRNLSWDGARSGPIYLGLWFEDCGQEFEWTVSLATVSDSLLVTEEVRNRTHNSSQEALLKAGPDEGWWWSDSSSQRVNLVQTQTECALAYASVDASFAARRIAESVRNWGFFDPSPAMVRDPWNAAPGGEQLNSDGDNLAEVLYNLSLQSPDHFETIVSATRDILNQSIKIEPRSSPNGFYFVQDEPGIKFPVHQMGVSSGTLRILALMTALFGRPETSLVGIEEPENYIHPAALASFAEHMLNARDRIQFMVTTHSPLLLDHVTDPGAVAVVTRDHAAGTVINRESDPDAVRRALDESGFSLGEYHQTKGFGG